MADAMRSLIDDLLAIYTRAGHEVTYTTERGETRRYWANRYMQALKRALDHESHGNSNAVVDFVEGLVTRPEPSRGFFYLRDADRLDLSVEAHVADPSKPYQGLFSREALDAARARLAEYGYDAAPLGPDVPFLVALHSATIADRTKSSLDRLGSIMSLEANFNNSFKRTLARDAHDNGASWREIAMRLGVTEQEATSQFGVKLPNGEIA